MSSEEKYLNSALEHQSMLPEFPKARRKMNELWNQTLFAGLNGSDPFLAEIPIRVQKEGDAAAIGSSEIQYRKHSVSISLPSRYAEGMNVEEFFGMASKLGFQMAGEQARTVFEELKKPSSHGMPLEWTGELDFEKIFSVWDKMDVDFDQDGKPIWPMMVLTPDAHAELNAKLPQWLEDPECRKQWAELTERKRKEFDEREACRRLVD